MRSAFSWLDPANSIAAFSRARFVRSNLFGSRLGFDSLIDDAQIATRRHGPKAALPAVLVSRLRAH